MKPERPKTKERQKKRDNERDSAVKNHVLYEFMEWIRTSILNIFYHHLFIPLKVCILLWLICYRTTVIIIQFISFKFYIQFRFLYYTTASSSLCEFQLSFYVSPHKKKNIRAEVEFYWHLANRNHNDINGFIKETFKNFWRAVPWSILRMALAKTKISKKKSWFQSWWLA